MAISDDPDSHSLYPVASYSSVEPEKYARLEGLDDDKCDLDIQAERDGILMLICHLQGLLDKETGAYKQLDSLHEMIRKGEHKRYVEIAQMEMREDGSR